MGFEATRRAPNALLCSVGVDIPAAEAADVGLDPSTKPTVTIGGMSADVMWFGDAPGYAGLQQINIMLPAGMAGVGRAPMMVTSNGQNSNVTSMHILPTTAMMQGMPGWGQGMMVGENMARGHELSYMAFNASNNTALVTDENDDVGDCRFRLPRGTGHRVPPDWSGSRRRNDGRRRNG